MEKEMKWNVTNQTCITSLVTIQKYIESIHIIPSSEMQWTEMAKYRKTKQEKGEEWRFIKEQTSENQVQTTIYLSLYGNPHNWLPNLILLCFEFTIETSVQRCKNEQTNERLKSERKTREKKLFLMQTYTDNFYFVVDCQKKYRKRWQIFAESVLKWWEMCRQAKWYANLAWQTIQTDKRCWKRANRQVLTVCSPLNVYFVSFFCAIWLQPALKYITSFGTNRRIINLLKFNYIWRVWLPFLLFLFFLCVDCVLLLLLNDSTICDNKKYLSRTRTRQAKTQKPSRCWSLAKLLHSANPSEYAFVHCIKWNLTIVLNDIFNAKIKCCFSWNFSCWSEFKLHSELGVPHLHSHTIS